jgi:hypothetical protein
MQLDIIQSDTVQNWLYKYGESAQTNTTSIAAPTTHRGTSIYFSFCADCT